MKALVLFSGGVDSSTCLAMALETYGPGEVMALSVSYGQKHQKELEAARRVAEYYNVPLRFLDLTSVFEGSDCSLLSASQKEVPKESYEQQLSRTKGAPVSTYVPFRNGLFISCAAAVALSEGCEVIYYGAHSDDAAGNAYPDCSPAFQEAIGEAVWEGSGCRVRLIAPFIRRNKAEVVREGLRLGVPYQLTWSCYEGQEKPCLRCGTCRDRLAAFAANGVPDPLSEVTEA